MWPFIARRLLYSIPIYLGIILIVMAALRVNDPVYAYVGKHASQEQVEQLREEMGLNQPFIVQYGRFVWRIVTLDFKSMPSWRYQGQSVAELLSGAVVPSLSVALPALVITTVISIGVGLVSSYYRGTALDRTLMFFIVLGMSISVLVFIILGQYFGAYWLKARYDIELFATGGYERGGGIGKWVYYCSLPVLIHVVLAMGYDGRFYRAVMVEETTREYVTTALAKGATRRKIMLVHVLKNAMIPIITRIMISFPFLIGGSILLETQFRIPGMGFQLISAITNKDFPVIQAFTAVFAAVFIATNILTDVLYALVDPRVRLS